MLPLKSSQPDCLLVSLLMASVMVPLLAQLANLSFAAGVFLSRYKVGHVTTLLKKPDLCTKDPANCRLITTKSTSAPFPSF